MYATRVTLCIERVALLGVGRCHAESASFGRVECWFLAWPSSSAESSRPSVFCLFCAHFTVIWAVGPGRSEGLQGDSANFSRLLSLELGNKEFLFIRFDF